MSEPVQGRLQENIRPTDLRRIDQQAHQVQVHEKMLSEPAIGNGRRWMRAVPGFDALSASIKEKHEYRKSNPKQIPRTQTPMTETLLPAGWFVLNFGFRSFVLVSDFEFRASSFLVTLHFPGSPRVAPLTGRLLHAVPANAMDRRVLAIWIAA